MRPSGTLRNNSTRANRMNIMSFLPKIVLVLLILSVAEGRSRRLLRHGTGTSQLGRTLHFPAERAEDKFGDGFKIIDARVFTSALKIEDGLWSDNARSKRATNDAVVDPNNRTTVASLDDSHTTLMVHWAGEGSDVIIALAKNIAQPSSALFLSKNYGRTFMDVSNQLLVDWSRKAVISNYYSTKSSNSHYVFTDEINKCIFTTDNSGDNFIRHCDLSFVPRVVKINSIQPSCILAMDDQSQLKQLYLTEDFGATWKAVYSQVKSFFWGTLPYDTVSTIFVVEEMPPTSGQTTGKLQVLKTQSLFHSSFDTYLVIGDVVDFNIRDDYMYATKSVNLLGSNYNPHLQLWVSYNRGEFVYAEFPGNHAFTDFYVADASEGQLMVCAYINNSHSNLYVSDVTGYKFSLSLEKIVYFNPKTMNNDNWIRLYSNETFADITKLHGINGIYIASRQPSDRLDIEEQQTMITYDKGGKWEMIKAPDYVVGNRPSNCTLARNCSLHLTQELHRLYPGSQSYPILTQRSSPGLVIASGVIGQTLKGDPDVFVSGNAGISWRQVLSGNYFYASGDHGGIIVAARQFIPTNEVVFSVDEGETWHSYRIVHDSIRIYGLLIEPGETSTVFSVFGSLLGFHKWQIIQIDFKDAFEGKKCGPPDYKMWSVSEDLPNNSCLLGHVTTYQRRIAHAICYNGDDFVRQFEVTNCTCKLEDFECDFGFEDNHGSCQRDLNVRDADVYSIPSNCSPGSFYSYTRGYRKVPGDTCVGGEEHKYGPLQYSCPIKERAEFLLVTFEAHVTMIDLANGAQIQLLNEYLPLHVPAIFDYERNCLMYVDIASNIKRMCFSSQNRSSLLFHEIIHMKENHTDVRSMAFDWTGRNIYYTDKNDTIRVVNVVGRFERTIYTANNGVHNPQTIIVDPHHGYLFFVGENSLSRNFSIFRAAMDGSDALVQTVTNEHVSHDTSLTIDQDMETLYWINPSTGTAYKSDISGLSVSVLFQEQSSFAPSCIAIYKNNVIISSKAGLGIRVANKHNPSAWSYFSSTMPVIGMVVVSNTSQHASSACSDYNIPCTHLCLPRPSSNNHNRTCLCGEGYQHYRLPSSLDETCNCEPGEIMVQNKTCVKAPNSTSCAATRLTCHNGNCVHLMWKCDGDDDCGDGSDEIDCSYTVCDLSTFTCRNGKCIPKQWECDQQDDCVDGFQSDELHCANRTCKSDQFKCNNSNCVSNSWVCDMDDDCQDNSDEQNCHNNTTTSCPSWYFTCDDGSCIDAVYKCNGHHDCLDFSDEKHCSNHTSNCTLDWQFSCGPEQECILLAWLCDGENDCSNGIDERNCNLTTPPATTMVTPNSSRCSDLSYTCRNGYCIGIENVCDGVNNCGDSSDETYCAGYRTTSPLPTVTFSSCFYDQFFCRIDHRCLPIAQRCDGHEDCPDGTDEENCATTCSADEYQCSQSSGRCIPKSWVCDGFSDCPQHDDEILCHDHIQSCLDTDFQCLMEGTCLPMSKRCNKVLDCDDDSDEMDCDYQGYVNCSNFNSAKEVCCSTPQCGVFTAGIEWFIDSHCQNTSQSLVTRSRNTCEGIIPAIYNCKADQFKCRDANMTCLSFVQVCDRKMDCNNGRDEQGCEVCPTLSPMETIAFSTGSTNITWKISFNFTILSYAEIVPGLSFANLTWRNMTNNKAFMVDKLKPATIYYFAFLNISSGVTCVLHSYTISTAESTPSAPTNLTAKVHVEIYPMTYSVHLTWRKPSLPRGNIISYSVYYQITDANGKGLSDIFIHLKYIYNYEKSWQSFNTTIIENISPNVTYAFWVTARTLFGEGPSSEKFIVHVVPTKNINITATHVTETSLKLQWDKADDATGYMINVRFPEVLDLPASQIKEMVLLANSSQTSIVVDGLCPGTTVFVGLQVKYANNVLGPELRPFNTALEGGEIHLNGTHPMAVFTKVDQTETRQFLMKYNLTAGGPVSKYYIYAYDELTAPVELSTTQMSHMLSVPFACQKYIVWIRPAYPTCPFTDRKDVHTGEDVKAPPKSVNVNVSRTLHHYSLSLTWKPSCSDKIQENYVVNIKIGNAENKAVSCSKQELIFAYVRDGTNYTFMVRTDADYSEESEPYTTFIPYIGKPYNILSLVNNGNNVTIWWQFPPKEDPANNFKQFVIHTKGDDVEIVKNTTDLKVSVLIQKEGKYTVTITAESTSGHVIGEPGYLEFPFENHVSSPYTGDISISKTNLVAILVPSCLVVVILSAGLVLFIVRHKRLQRSFLAFANSHYNIQSGTTTFSEDMGLDGDEPLIQGFSDDEPLVIA